MRQLLFLSILFLTALPAHAAETKWSSFISATEVAELVKQDSTVLIDARSSEQYAQGHIPGAINLPGGKWRTSKAKPGEGDSQYIFRTEDGAPDIARYEEFLSKAGIKNSDTIVVYGNHAGKADGSIPALLLRWLGHEKVKFLDGVGIEEWTKAGFETSTEKRSLPKSNYKATPIKNFVWNLNDVRKSIGSEDVVFYDTRSIEEFTGEEPRSNKRAGHIPGAVRIDYKDLLGADKKVLEPSVSEKLHAEAGIEKDKTIVLYCQTATRVSLPALELLDLGYENIAIYDASWHEYGNRNDTDIVVPEDTIASRAEKTQIVTPGVATTINNGQTSLIVPGSTGTAGTVITTR